MKATKEKTLSFSDVVTLIDPRDLKPNPFQPATRIDIDAGTAKEFYLSFERSGLIHFPVVRKTETGEWQVGDGWLRRAGYMYGLINEKNDKYATIPCVVRTLTDEQMADLVIEANTERKDMNDLDLAKLYKRYLDDFGYTQETLAKKFGKSQGEISNTIRLLELPTDIQAKVISREISETHGRQLLRLNYRPDLQQEVMAKAIEQGYSVNELSNRIQSKLYDNSENLEPDRYPKPEFDLAECEKCPSRQKIGTPYSTNQKTWRCINPKCYKVKTEQAEKARVEKIQAEIAAARKEAGDSAGKSKGKNKDSVLALDKLTWRDYEILGQSYKKIDNPTECESCPRRALGKHSYDKQPHMVCVDVKCFKSKEKAYQAKEEAKAKEVEKKLTERVKLACDNFDDVPAGLKIISDYLLGHSRKDTREKYARMQMFKEPDLQKFCFDIRDEGWLLRRLISLAITLERFEGDKGCFRVMLARVEGNTAEVEQELAAYRSKHCQGCAHDDGNCSHMVKSWGENITHKCYMFKEGEKQVDDNLNESEADFAPPTPVEIDADSAAVEVKSVGEKTDFDILLDSGEVVKVSWEPGFNNHLEFRSKAISETGYRSDFPMEMEKHFTLDEIKEHAKKRAEELATLRGQELAAKAKKKKGSKKS